MLINKKLQRENIYKLKEEPKVETDPSKNKFYDPRVPLPKVSRTKRTFQFVEPGTFVRKAERIRTQAMKTTFSKMLEKQNEEENVGGEDPNSLIQTLQQERLKRPKDPIPDVEWWDIPFLQNGTYYTGEPEEDREEGLIGEEIVKKLLKEEKITLYVEHPVLTKPPNQPALPPVLPLMLTPAERKKLRKRKRMEVHREKQQRILLGLEPPPPPKLKISNFMQVLGKEAVADPTQIEAEVRRQMAQRIANHEQRNQERKLTPEERKAKKMKKLFEDASKQIAVALFRVEDLSNGKFRYKVDVNAQENHLSGCVILYSNANLVLVEGGPKSIKRFKKLMLQRIKWNEDEDDDDDENQKKKKNQCHLVWEGNVMRPSFKGFRMEQCLSEALARKFMKERGVEHYWDFVVNFKPDGDDAPPPPVPSGDF
eukprot:TRINITY_DN1087_c0_g1_i1.p1 TRINITY_DN1087_c0_g1~~TRINITY_DN1087_c0_g1_i1.p1  ORF type:complete len:475 (+),score=168.83 TRINITY_DN1087_c0_g1_i1:153-1427(+)